MLTLDTRIVRSSDALASEIDGELVMMHAESGAYYNLDSIGTDIWNRIADPIEISELCTSLDPEYDAALDVICRDVLALLNQMAEKGLIQIAQ